MLYYITIKGGKMAYWSYPFDHNDYLTRMGASWFVSYSYYKYIDKYHNNWNKLKKNKVDFNIKIFNESKKYHYNFLKDIVKNVGCSVGKNKIGLSSDEVKEMAKKLLFRYFIKYVTIVSTIIIMTAIIVFLYL